MRQRLPKDFFNTIKGIEFVPDFYDGIPFYSKVEKESVIETVYNNNTIMSSLGKVDIVKKGWTDGLMRFRYNGRIISFYGLQEAKRDVNPTVTQLTKQLLQALGYYSQLESTVREDCLVFCLNSAYFYGYILRSQIEELIEKVIPLINESGLSASKLYSNLPNAKALVRDWIEEHYNECHLRGLEGEEEAKAFEINEVLREIYLNCL